MLTTLPFGMHKGTPLADVPLSYLTWLTGRKLSSGLRTAIEAELVRRGATPPPAPPRPAPRCPDCKSAAGAPIHRWHQDRRGRMAIRRTCPACNRWLGFAPLVEPFIGEANAAASSTAVLDALMLCEEKGVQLQSDGQAVHFATADDWKRAPQRLHDLIHQCGHTLASMLGRTQR